MNFSKWTNLVLNLRTPAFAGVFVVILLFGLFVPLFSTEALTVTPKVELNADPGATLKTTFKITNEERQTRTFYLRYENFNSQDETGTPSFSTRQEGLATWIKSPNTITIGPGETIDMPVEINVPKDVEPGGHFAAVFFSTQPPEIGAGEGKVAIGTRLGTLILLRVNGDFLQDATILEFNTTGKKKIFTQLPVQFYFRFQNTGDDHQKPLGDIQIKNIFGRTVKILSANTIDGSVLPKSIRKFVSVWTAQGGGLKQEPVIELPPQQKLDFWSTVVDQWHNFAFGRYTANLKVVYGTKELKSVHNEIVFYIIPWQLLSIAIPSLIVTFIVLVFGIKRYNRYIIAKASKPTKSKKTK